MYSFYSESVDFDDLELFGNLTNRKNHVFPEAELKSSTWKGLKDKDKDGKIEIEPYHLEGMAIEREDGKKKEEST